jgi:hypothetical protein
MKILSSLYWGWLYHIRLHSTSCILQQTVSEKFNEFFPHLKRVYLETLLGFWSPSPKSPSDFCASSELLLMILPPLSGGFSARKWNLDLIACLHAICNIDFKANILECLEHRYLCKHTLKFELSFLSSFLTLMQAGERFARAWIAMAQECSWWRWGT